MSGARVAVAAALIGGALLAPLLAGSAETPAAAASAAQLLPPRTVVCEVRLEGGGFLRAREIDVVTGGYRVRSPEGWRDLPGLRGAGGVEIRRLWLGSDHQGRDLLARMAHGARTSVLVAGLATLLAVSIGAAAGLGAALSPGWIGRVVRVVGDTLLGLPRLLLLLVLGSALRGSLGGIAATIGLVSWMEVGRLVEGEATSLAGRPFFEAMRAAGAGRVRVGARHLLPNLLPVLAVAAPLVATEAVLLEATLSFLGVDAGLGAASWGRIVADGQRLLPGGWWVAVLPGLVLTAFALAVHALGRDPYDVVETVAAGRVAGRPARINRPGGA